MLGLCGRGGAGKTTVANYLCNGFKYEKITILDPMDYVVKKLFGQSMSGIWHDTIWKLTYEEARRKVQELLKLAKLEVPIVTKVKIRVPQSDKWVEIAFWCCHHQARCVTV